MDKKYFKEIFNEKINEIIHDLLDYGYIKEYEEITNLWENFNDEIKEIKEDNFLNNYEIFSRMLIIKKYLQKYLLNDRNIGENVYFHIIDLKNIEEEFENVFLKINN